jgi:hypothetical protein
LAGDYAALAHEILLRIATIEAQTAAANEVTAWVG